MYKSASLSCPETPKIGSMPEPDGVLVETSASSVPRDLADGGESRRSSDQPIQPVLSSRSEEYRLFFRLPSEEVLGRDFNCALQENILLQGHMYLFVNYVCFYSNIFGFETKKILHFNEVSSVQKAKTAGFFPNAVEVVAGEKKYFFTSFLSRDEAYQLIVDGWTQSNNNNAKYLMDRQDSRSEIGSVENKSDLLDRFKSLRRPGSFDSNPLDRNKEEIVEGLQRVCIDAEEISDGLIKGELLSFQGNRGSMSEGPEQSEVLPSRALTWNPEDIAAPKIPAHYKMVADGSKFPIHPEDFFKFFFSDGSFDFCERFHKRCGDRNFQCDPWYMNEQSGHRRELSFQHPIKLYLGARFARCREIQKLRVYKNCHMVVEVTQLMNDAPYSDYFTVEGLWDVECNADEGKGCILRVYMNVAFSKKTMFRGKIEQATAEEYREAYTTWINCAHEFLREGNTLVFDGTVRTRETSIQHETGPAERVFSHELVDNTLEVLEGTVHTGGASIQHKTEPIERSFSHTVDGSNKVLSPRIKRCRDEANRSSGVSQLTEIFNSLYACLRNQSNFMWLSVAVFLLIFQLIIIFLLMRGSRTYVHQEGLDPSIGDNRAETISWLESRLNFLKEELLVVESRLDNMRNECSLLKAHLQRLEDLWPKS